MKINCFIVRDLLPLYNENLLSEETTAWTNEHLENCLECKKIQQASLREITTEPIEDPMDAELMFKRINRKLSMYQIIFIALSFFLAANTSMLNESFGFILWYPVLGALIYLFYKDMKLVFMLSFIPMILWAFGENIIDFTKGAYVDISFWAFLSESLFSCFFMAIIHFLFAAIGALIGYLIILIKSKDQ